jgi:predicted dehydrogenase/nucleoside-diphosphate-sugar epimerase
MVKTIQVALIGAGNIARTHIAALSTVEGVKVVGVFDVNKAAAQAFAKEFGIPQVFDTLEEAAQSPAESFHVMTPPDFHLSSAMPFVLAGKNVFLEKPVGVSSDECAQLRDAAQKSGATIGVNQNLVFNPAYVKLRETVLSGRLGKPRFMNYVYEAPLRQLSARQFSHWMFRQPLNILLEQAVHPLSQIIDLAGSVQELNCLSEPPVEISPGVGLHNASQVSMLCERMPVQLRFHVGAEFTVCRMTVVCDDGVAVADIFANQFHTIERTAYMEPVDIWLSARKTAKSIVESGFAVLRDYSLAMVKLKSRSDQFYLGMKGSIEQYYNDLHARRTPRIDLEYGAHLVQVCEQMAAAFKPDPVREPAVTTEGNVDRRPVAVVLGGTGFIGAYTVKSLLKNGYYVRVVARGVSNLQAVFYQSGVELVRGDVKKAADLEKALVGADYVINLAHGGGGANFEAIRAAMVDSARMVAKICVEQGVKRLVHVGSISGLYLGQSGEIITGATLPDQKPHTRNDYAHAKALADAEVLNVGQSGLEVVLLRPGLVIGHGTSPFHGGLGFFNNDQYCIGWNDGNNSLPWVLVEDCAEAIAAALTAKSSAGKAYNLVGDVRPSARAYLEVLGQKLNRPLHFVPSTATGLWLVEMGKWLIKRVAGRNVGRPYRRDIQSRGLLASFDCSDAKRDLAWNPVADQKDFYERAILENR